MAATLFELGKGYNRIVWDKAVRPRFGLFKASYRLKQLIYNALLCI